MWDKEEKPQTNWTKMKSTNNVGKERKSPNKLDKGPTNEKQAATGTRQQQD